MGVSVSTFRVNTVAEECLARGILKGSADIKYSHSQFSRRSIGR